MCDPSKGRNGVLVVREESDKDEDRSVGRLSFVHRHAHRQVLVRRLQKCPVRAVPSSTSRASSSGRAANQRQDSPDALGSLPTNMDPLQVTLVMSIPETGFIGSRSLARCTLS